MCSWHDKCITIYFTDESTLLDLKHLLIEARQKVPPFLAALQSENDVYLDIGGKFMLQFF